MLPLPNLPLDAVAIQPGKTAINSDGTTVFTPAGAPTLVHHHHRRASEAHGAQHAHATPGQLGVPLGRLRRPRIAHRCSPGAAGT